MLSITRRWGNDEDLAACKLNIFIYLSVFPSILWSSHAINNQKRGVMMSLYQHISFRLSLCLSFHQSFEVHVIINKKMMQVGGFGICFCVFPCTIWSSVFCLLSISVFRTFTFLCSDVVNND